jgi:peptidoglycan/LPS O-acetylase OafA/YrhL
MKRLDQLTFIRFIMVTLVLLYHGYGGIYDDFLNGVPFLPELLRTAPTAVGYLYVLSGFVMALVYYRPQEKFDIISYWKARFVRIYPLYLIAFLLTSYYYLDGILGVKPLKILANLFVVQAWVPTYAQSFNYASWSMTVEFFFYAIFPFFVIWAYRQPLKKLVWISLGLWIVSQTIYQGLWIGYLDTHRNFIIYSPIFHINSFIMGVVGGIWYLRVGKYEQLKPLVILSVLAASFLLMAGYSVVSLKYIPTLPNDLQPMAGLLAPIMIVFIVSLAMDTSKLSRFLDRPWLVNLGEASYAIYILHVPVIWLFERYLFDSSLAFAGRLFEFTVLPLMIFIGILLHFYVDIPLRRWLRNTLQHVNIPLFLLDLIIVLASIFLVFRLRFGEGREYNSYLVLIRLMFWSVFFVRTAIAIRLRVFDPASFQLPLTQSLRPVLISTTLGSLAIAAIGYAGFAAGMYENFPRSIYAVDWFIVLSLSVSVRLLFRFWLARYPKLVPQV